MFLSSVQSLNSFFFSSKKSLRINPNKTSNLSASSCIELPEKNKRSKFSSLVPGKDYIFTSFKKRGKLKVFSYFEKNRLNSLFMFNLLESVLERKLVLEKKSNLLSLSKTNCSFWEDKKKRKVLIPLLVGSFKKENNNYVSFAFLKKDKKVKNIRKEKKETLVIYPFFKDFYVRMRL